MVLEHDACASLCAELCSARHGSLSEATQLRSERHGCVSLPAPHLLALPQDIRHALRESRALNDCISDLHAQVAANTRGASLVQELVCEATAGGRGGLTDVHAYMTFVASAAEEAVREMLASASRRLALPPVGTVHALDYMDDGSAIRLALTLDREKRTAIFDFTGTDPEVRKGESKKRRQEARVTQVLPRSARVHARPPPGARGPRPPWREPPPCAPPRLVAPHLVTPPPTRNAETPTVHPP